MSVAPAHRTHDSDSTFVPDLGAEVGQVTPNPTLPRGASPHVGRLSPRSILGIRIKGLAPKMQTCYKY